MNINTLSINFILLSPSSMVCIRSSGAVKVWDSFFVNMRILPRMMFLVESDRVLLFWEVSWGLSWSSSMTKFASILELSPSDGKNYLCNHHTSLKNQLGDQAWNPFVIYSQCSLSNARFPILFQFFETSLQLYYPCIDDLSAFHRLWQDRVILNSSVEIPLKSLG